MIEELMILSGLYWAMAVIGVLGLLGALIVKGVLWYLDEVLTP